MCSLYVYPRTATGAVAILGLSEPDNQSEHIRGKNNIRPSRARMHGQEEALGSYVHLCNAESTTANLLYDSEHCMFIHNIAT